MDDSTSPIDSNFALNDALEEIERVSSVTESYSNYIGVVTAINFLLLFATAISLRINMEFILADRGMFYFVMICISPSVLAIAVYFLNRFERITAIGNNYYQEISDSLEWAKASKNTLLESRLKMKRFVSSATLPFYRNGKNGSIIYLVANAMICLATVMIIVVFVK